MKSHWSSNLIRQSMTWLCFNDLQKPPIVCSLVDVNSRRALRELSFVPAAETNYSDQRRVFVEEAGSLQDCATGCTEIHSTVIYGQFRDGEACIALPVSFQTDFAFHVVLWVRMVEIHVAEEFKSSVSLLFVPEDLVIVGHAVVTIYLIFNRFIQVLDQSRRDLVNPGTGR